MSHLQYFSYAQNFHYSQSVRLPHDQILVSGQPGLDRATGKIPTDLREEIDQAFRNVDTAVKEAGGESRKNVTVVCDRRFESNHNHSLENSCCGWKQLQKRLIAHGVYRIGDRTSL